MKGKVIIVLFSLALAFGMIVASCDNGNDPLAGLLVPDHKSIGELDGELYDGPAAPDVPLDPAKWYGVDFVDNDTGKPTGKVGAQGDGKADVDDDGAPLLISKDAGDKLIAKTGAKQETVTISGTKYYILYQSTAFVADGGGTYLGGNPTNMITKTLSTTATP